MKLPVTPVDRRDNPDDDPPVDSKAIREFINRQRNDPLDIDLTIFVLIEECNSWNDEYRRLLDVKKHKKSAYDLL